MATPKMPHGQMLILGAARFAEPISLTSMTTYLPEMVGWMGTPKDDIGYWVGVLGASFNIAQGVGALPWGWISDLYGRKLIVVVSNFGDVLTFVVWGVTTNLPLALSVRIISGLSNGQVGIIRTIVAELVPWKELQPAAFSYMPLIWTVGCVIGPVLGGLLANPADRFPRVFGRVQFFIRYPYALGSFTCAFLFLLSMVTAVLFLKETHRDLKNRPDWGLAVGNRLVRFFSRKKQDVAPYRDSIRDPEATESLLPSSIATPSMVNAAAVGAAKDPGAPRQKRPAWSAVFNRRSVILLITYCSLCIWSLTFDILLPVLLSYPVVVHTPDNTRLPFYFSGGFGYSPIQIGTIWSLYGCLLAGFQYIVYPPISRKIGILNCLRYTILAMPFITLLVPYAVIIPDPGVRCAGLMAILILKGVATLMLFPTCTILLSNSARTVTMLASLNGVATMFVSLSRAACAIFTGYLMSLGFRLNYIVLPWFWLSFVGTIIIIFGYMADDPGPLLDAISSAPDTNGCAADGSRSSPAVGPESGRNDSDGGHERTALLNTQKPAYGVTRQGTGRD